MRKIARFHIIFDHLYVQTDLKKYLVPFLKHPNGQSKLIDHKIMPEGKSKQVLVEFL